MIVTLRLYDVKLILICVLQENHHQRKNEAKTTIADLVVKTKNFKLYGRSKQLFGSRLINYMHDLKLHVKNATMHGKLP